MIRIYTQTEQAKKWLQQYRDCQPTFACVLGFTETALIPGISAAGKTPENRKYTACADAEFLYYGANHQPKYPLPPLIAGASPTIISRAIIESLNIPLHVFNTGLPQPPPVPVIDVGGVPARCLSQGNAMELSKVQHLLERGLLWGERLSKQIHNRYLIIGECVVGGTTTALAILTALGINAAGKVNSSHPVCNHEQKLQLVQTGLEMMNQRIFPGRQFSDFRTDIVHRPLQLIAAVGDPMQVFVAGMTIAASRNCGVLLAGGTQMLAVYALASAIAHENNLNWESKQVVVGTTRWVAEDPTGGTVELAKQIGSHEYKFLREHQRKHQRKFTEETTEKTIKEKNFREQTPVLLATQLYFTNSRYSQLQIYEQGFVKEGVGAGGLCIAASLSHDWQQKQFLQAIEGQLERYYSPPSNNR
ncbi:nicotinate mononucleotide-dependent phosphoribosyltransferase CobT [Mastigocoleus testarum]|uniref:UPF0284 protein BC008_32480 n=1 Tax=Mastigocoleus testarum BC008 TaxID=371196 RepID=A0A0V7ZW18_9CYAN|nr:TIGR00303 family protein [Mastigocoleus testarum]KST68140.1 hypothetical protein BC008_32480 [Mastigocoleus testarum BC008]KST68803.1 hypothetical protein BC008_34165 [Mastigocoleus testarum BC008]